ncbi:MAG: hypothetical protein ABJA81_10165 [Nocardioidaceae bacterium]
MPPVLDWAESNYAGSVDASRLEDRDNEPKGTATSLGVPQQTNAPNTPVAVTGHDRVIREPDGSSV